MRGVDLIRSVTHADYSRLASRAGPAISRTIGVNKHHCFACAAQLISRPRTKHAGANDCDIESLSVAMGGHCNRVRPIAIDDCRLRQLPVREVGLPPPVA